MPKGQKEENKMAKKEKEKRKSLKEVDLEYQEFMSLKINEAKGMYIGSREATEAANVVGTLYSKYVEAKMRIRESQIHLGEAIVGAIGMGTEIGMHERDVRTCLGLETIYHSGKGEIANLRKDFKPRKYLK